MLTSLFIFLLIAEDKGLQRGQQKAVLGAEERGTDNLHAEIRRRRSQIQGFDEIIIHNL